jgi:hypothetical protein
MADRITLQIEITQEQADRLTGWSIPADMAGPTVADRIGFLIDDACIRLAEQEREESSIALHRQFGVKHPRDKGPAHEF